MTDEVQNDSTRATPSLSWWLLLLSWPVLMFVAGIQIAHLFVWASALPEIDNAALMQRLIYVVVPVVAAGLAGAIVSLRYVRYKIAAAYRAKITGLQNKQSYQQELVRLIADNRPGKTVIIDHEDRLWFVNGEAAKSIEGSAQDAIGRAFDKVLPQGDVRRIMPLLKHVRETNERAEAIGSAKDDGRLRFVQTHIVPLPPLTNMIRAVMVSEEDVTGVLVEREARERMFRQVIDTLVAVVDRRDPFAAGHSSRVGEISRAIAAQMGLDSVQVETAEISGLLMNFGKVLVPRAILTKTTALTPEELKQVRESLLGSADILALIGFSQPVVPTLRQALERYDGSGIPHGLRGDNILVTARIVTVANAFVALVSARAHRPSMSVRAAIESLQQNVGRAYDGRVVAGLTNAIALKDHGIEWLASQ